MSNFVTFFLLESIDDGVKFALIPWQTFPPHKGHYEFIKHYSDLIGENGKVVVFIENNSNKKVCKDILSEYVSDLPNVIISVASKSAIQSVKDFGTEASKISNSSTIVLACTRGSKAISQMIEIKKHYEQNYPDCYVIHPQSTACDVKNQVSDNLFKRALSDKKEVVQFLPDHLSQEQRNKIVNILTHLN